MSQLEIPADRLETATAQEVLEWALPRFGDRIAIASSFGVEDVTLIDIAAQIRSTVRVFCLDTGRLHQQTYDLMDRIRNRYGLTIEVLYPSTPDLESMVREHGINLFYDSIENRRRCCDVRKVQPLRRVLSTLDAWVTGLRREQNVSRANIAKVEVDHANGGLLKINPLADWSHDQLWAHIRDHSVPYNTLHDEDYPSISCEPCTRPVQTDEDPRSGRWWWESAETRECGLHVED